MNFNYAKKVDGGYEVQVPDYSKPTGMGGFQTTTQFIPDSAVGSVEVRETPIGFGMVSTSYNLSGVDLNRPATVATQTGLLADPEPLTDPEPYQGTIQDTLFESSQYYADSPMGQSHNAVPYTTDYVPVAVQQALEAEANQDVTPVFNPVENLTQAVSGLNFMPTNLTGQFFGINPTTNAVELMSNMASNPMFRSGVAGFTDTLPTGFEFGTPNVYRNISSYTPETFEEFVAQKEAEEAEAKKNRYQITGMGSDFDQARLNETI